MKPICNVHGRGCNCFPGISKVPERGWGPWKEVWFSICSGPHDPECERCKAGYWRNSWALAFDRFIFVRWPDIWKTWANR